VVYKLTDNVLHVVAMVMYFTYSIHHSKLNDAVAHQCAEYERLDDVTADDDDNADDMSSL